MKTTNQTSRARNAARRSEILAAFDRSGLTAAAFARQHKLNYTTFSNWRCSRRAKKTGAPGFVQVELAEPAGTGEVVIELGSQARIRISAPQQIEMAARLLQKLNPLVPC